jgi:hypothetical protein
MFGEIDYEKRALVGDAKLGGVVYDGRKVLDISTRILGPKLSPDSASVVVTDRLVSTFSRDDLRHHLRTIVFGFPSVISLPGIVEAPAKPREYYLMKQQLEMRGASDLDLERLKSSFRGRFIEYGDPATTEVLKGLVLQSVIYHLTLDPFCRNKDCRLFNAHWQEDLIRSQVRSASLCDKHSRLIKRLAKNPEVQW